MLCVFLACHNLSQFDYPFFFSAHQEPGIKAHMLNRVSFHPIMHQSFATTSPSGPGNSGDIDFSICKAQV